MDLQKILEAARLDASELDVWIEAGWLAPQRHDGAPRLSAMDVARAQLIRDLKYDFGVNDHGVPLILDLLDQIHGLRRSMDHLLAGVRAQPDETRSRIIAHVRQVRLTAGTGGGTSGDDGDDTAP